MPEPELSLLFLRPLNRLGVRYLGEQVTRFDGAVSGVGLRWAQGNLGPGGGGFV
jgi:hypothetical protein